jgi:hypothetical protein
MDVLPVIAASVAVGAAGRSLWSPCGLSMLSTVNPMSERARGHRYGLTATWFVVGAVLGGCALAALTAVLALGVSAVGAPLAGRLVAAALVCVLAGASDAGMPGLRVPTNPRQVDETWLGRYRRWVYAAGFGVQIGSGLATYVMTAGVYATVALAALTANPGTAAAVAVGFGLTRGLLVLVGAWATDPRRLARQHRWLDRHAGTSVAAMVVLLTAAGLAAAAAVPGPARPVILAVVAAITLATAVRAVTLARRNVLAGRAVHVNS